jgi:hypothetical protein
MPPWSLLELDPAVATERDVKRAYAKRLKLCRPDQDPEGFRELHDAYTRALAELQWRQTDDPGESPLISLQEPAPAVPDHHAEAPFGPETVPSLPFTAPAVPIGVGLIDDAFSELDAVLRSGKPGAADLVRAAEALLYRHPEQVMLWGERMHDLITRHGDHPDLKLKPEAMLFELEHDGYAATVAIIDRLDRQAGVEGLTGLARLLTSQKGRIANPGTGLAASHLASVLAFWSRDASSPVADLAYENLDRGEREFRMQLIDRHASMADLLLLAPSSLKSFWRQQFLGNSPRESWDGPDGQMALRWLQRTSMSPHVFQTLFDLVPKELSATFKRKAAPSVARSTPSRDLEWDQAPAPRPSSQPARRQTSTRVPIRFIGIILFLVVKAAMLVGTCSQSPSDSRSQPFPRLETPSHSPGRPRLSDPPTQSGGGALDSVEFKDLLSTPKGRILIDPDAKERSGPPSQP